MVLRPCCFRSPDDRPAWPPVTQRHQSFLPTQARELPISQDQQAVKTSSISDPRWVVDPQPLWPMFLVDLEELQHTASPPASAALLTPPLSQGLRFLPQSPAPSNICSTRTRTPSRPILRPPSPTAVSTGPCLAWMPQTCTPTSPGGLPHPQTRCPHTPASMQTIYAQPTSPTA